LLCVDRRLSQDFAEEDISAAAIDSILALRRSEAPQDFAEEDIGAREEGEETAARIEACCARGEL